MTRPSSCVGLLAEGLDPARGGAERAVRAVAAALAGRGAEVVVAAPADRVGPPLPGVRLVEVAAARARPWRDLALSRDLARAARDAGAARLVACGKALDADLYWPHGGVHAASRAAWSAAGRGPLAAGWARFARALRPTEWALDAIEARALDACRGPDAPCRAVALSDRVAADLRRHHGVEVAAVVRNGADPARFAPAPAAAREAAAVELRARARAHPAAALALFVAHAFRLKGLDLLLAAAARVPAAHVVVAGADRSPSAVPAELEGRVTFLGPVDDVAPLYRGADLLVHPSRYDPCSLVVLEALASGLPVIASTADGASEVVAAARAGAVVPPDDLPALVAALERLVDPAARAPLAAAASASRRTWDDVARDLLALLAV